jgi:pimeloyl-ACP methyl ester carboxylesterase
MELAVTERGSGHPVLCIAGRGAVGRTWHLHQVPAFLDAGYRVITFDNRGVGATEDLEDFTLQTMVDDTIALIETRAVAPAHIVATSMGSLIAQELMLARPDLVSSAALMATRGRHDRTRLFFRDADRALAGVPLPATLDAKLRLLEGLSPTTLNDERVVEEWIATFTMWPTRSTPGLRHQYTVSPDGGRLEAYRRIETPVLIIGFADDVVSPPHLGAEVADALPNGSFQQIGHAGHLGFLEQPHAVNSAILKFFADNNR